MSEVRGPAGAKVSVIVCTWNRSETLQRCLQSLEAQALANDAYEVVVVDNRSIDGTPGAVAGFASGTDMTVRYIREDRQGLSHARNAGIETAAGELLAFIDDDCTVEPGYVEALLHAFEETGADLVAGRVTSVPPEDLMSDLPKRFDASKKLAHLDLGPERRAMLPHEYALGGNLAVRKSLAVEVGGFKHELGYSGESKVVGEDTEFCDRVRATGALMVWEPRAAVIHRVGPERFTRAAYRKAAFSYGQGSLRRSLAKNPDAGECTGAAVRSCLSIPLYGIAWVLALWSPALRFEVELKMMSARGKLDAALDYGRPLKW